MSVNENKRFDVGLDDCRGFRSTIAFAASLATVKWERCHKSLRSGNTGEAERSFVAFVCLDRIKPRRLLSRRCSPHELRAAVYKIGFCTILRDVLLTFALLLTHTTWVHVLQLKIHCKLWYSMWKNVCCVKIKFSVVKKIVHTILHLFFFIFVTASFRYINDFFMLNLQTADIIIV